MFLAMLFTLTAFNSFAAWNEVECEGRVGNASVDVDIERGPQGSPFRNAVVRIVENGGGQMYRFPVVGRSAPGWNRVDFSGRDMSLEVDFWPDRAPRWGMSYRGALRSTLIGYEYIQDLRCRFPNVK